MDEESKEEIVEDSDTDTRDTENSEKTDEEQVVRDTDADTSVMDERLDRIEQNQAKLMASVQRLIDAQSVLVESGAIIDADPDPSEDDGISNIEDDFDLSI